MTTQRLSLAVSDPGAVAAELAGGLFVPTRLNFTLGEVVDLSLRLPHLSRPLDVPAVIVGRRPPRTGSVLSAGVVVRAADRHHPVLEILLDVVDGTMVDLETRLQQRLRLPARVTFATAADARAELACMLDPHGATLNLDAPAVRGDRLALAVVVNGAVVLTVPALVRRLQLQEQTTSCVVVPLDDEARDLLVRFLRASDVVGRQA
jgi:Tfp pilus assembly protein PilZ